MFFTYQVFSSLLSYMALGSNIGNRQNEKSEVDSKKDKSDLESISETTSELASEQDEYSEINYEQYCVFKTGGEEYAIPIDIVKEVVKFPEAAPVPHMPDYIIGMSNVRGNIYGILDLGLFFKREGKDQSERKYLLVIDHPEFKVALTIPDVPDTVMVTDKMIEQLTTSGMKSETGQKYLKGIIKKDKRMIVLFDVLGMISSDVFTEVSA